MHEASSRGVLLLREAKRSFEGLGMRMEGAFVGLDLAEVLLLESAGAAEAMAVCSAVLETFESEKLAAAKLKAVAYLCAAVRARQASVALVRYVRTYLEVVDRNPNEVFAPSPLPVM
jgi:hypothetical protein